MKIGELFFCCPERVEGPAESSSFAVESLMRTFDLKPADAFIYEGHPNLLELV